MLQTTTRESIRDFINKCDPRQVIPEHVLRDYQRKLLEKYEEWRKNESPDRDMKIQKTFYDILPYFTNDVNVRDRILFYSDFSRKILWNYAMKCSQHQNSENDGKIMALELRITHICAWKT